MTLLLLTACTREPEPEPVPVVEVVELPTVVVDGPLRGSFWPGGSRVLVQGTVTAGTHALGALEVNGVQVDYDEAGWFTTEIEGTPGINLLGVRIEDAGGERAVDGRSFHYGGDHEHGAVLPDAVWMRLGPSLLDDDESTPDDLAAIAELMVSDPSIADGFLGTRIVEEDYELEITGIDWTGAAVDLTPNDGVLWADVLLSGVRLEFNVFGVGWYSWVSTSGYVTADTVLIQTDMTPSGTEIEVTAVYASIEGFELEIEWVPFDDLLADSAREALEENLRTTISELAGDLVTEYLEAYAVDLEPFPGVNLAMELASLEVRETGLALTMDATVKALGNLDLPWDAGSLAAVGTRSWSPTEPFAVAIDDDLVNALLFAMWAQGGLAFEFDGDALGALTGAPLPPPLGPVQHASLSLGLPPVLVPGDDEHDLTLSLGEFVVDLLREDGERVTASVNAAAGGWLEQQGAELAISLDDRPRHIEVEVGMLAAPASLDPGDLASLFRLTTPTLLGSAGAFTPAIPLPGVPLDLLGSHPDLVGKELMIADATVSFHDSGWLTVAGPVEVVE